MSKPLLNQSPSIGLAVGADRKLRADARISTQRNNAIEQRANGLYVEQFTPVGALIQQRPLVGQTFPIFGSAVVGAPSMMIYDSALADSDGMWDPATPTRLNITKPGRYLVSSHGRYKSVSGYQQYYAWFWVAKNGDEQSPIAIYNPNLPGPTTDPASLGSPAGGGVNDTLSGTYHCQNLVDLVAGDYLVTYALFQYASGSLGNAVTTLTSSTPRGDIGSQFLGAVTVDA